MNLTRLKLEAYHYEALAGKDAYFEALTGEVENYEILSGGGEVTCYETLASEDNNCIAPAVKDGQQFVTTEGFEEDQLGQQSQVQQKEPHARHVRPKYPQHGQS